MAQALRPAPFFLRDCTEVKYLLVPHFMSARFRFNLSKLIEARGFTQRSLATEIGVTPSRLSKYLNGHSDIHSDTLLKLVRTLGIGIEEWLESILTQSQRGTETDSVDRALLGAVRQMEPADRQVISSYVLKYASAISRTKARGELSS